jgi:DNA-binding NtrC family response regulator
MKISEIVQIGTTLALELPSHCYDTWSKLQIKMISPDQGLMPPRRVLLVDAEDAVRESLRRVLTGENYVVNAFSNVADAMESLESQPCDVAVIDLQPGDTDGRQLARQIKHTYLQMPVVLMTTCPERTPSRMLEECVAVLVKPFDVSALLETVRNASEQSRSFRVEDLETAAVS